MLQFILIVYCAVAVANFASGVFDVLRSGEQRKLDPAGWATLALAAVIWPVSVPIRRMERASAPTPIAIPVRTKTASRDASLAQSAGDPEPALPTRSIPVPGIGTRSTAETTLARSQRTPLE